MKRYFEVKDEIKRVKKEIAENMENNYNPNEPCDCLLEISDESLFCDECKVRHTFYKRLKSLRYEGVSIIHKVRKIVK